MKAYRLLLGFFGLALLAAVVAWLVGADPGYVLIQRAPYTVETTLVFALGAVLAAWLVLALLWWLVRWPLRAMLVRARRRGRIRFARGALALTEGRWVRAEKLLLGSSRMRSVKLPALIGAYHAARLRGDARRQGEVLERLGAE
ncbi:MAG TPA: heme biosynthesis HemY N-terminal domain-containing protein, partial [Pseudomonadota bacterium]|nr:heme biosynthesis HemY N-terminal domain-containing protein [Pseudomonadota bacterium]